MAETVGLPIGTPNAAVNQSKQRIQTEAKDAEDQKQLFLKLMIAQLRNQDPSAPMDQKDMMASITQMSQVEQMVNLTNSMQSIALSQGIGLIDKTIDYQAPVIDAATGNTTRMETRTGKVASIAQSGGQVTLRMADGSSVKPNTVTGIRP